mgnify:CR=1 FL=1
MTNEMRNNIKNKLKELNYKQSLTFGYLLCKKLFPDYALFSEYEDFGKPDILYSGLIALRKHISRANNEKQIDNLTKELWEDEDITPDTDDFPGNISASLALNSLSAMYHTLKYANIKEIELIEKVSNLSLESVTMFFVVNNNIDQNMPKEEYNQIINNSIFVQSEIQLQRNLIEKIQTIGQTTQRFYTKIRTNESKLVENSLYSQFVYV